MSRSRTTGALPWFAVLLSMLPALLQVAVARAEPPAVEDFFRRPKLSGFQLSPDGKYLAAIVPIGERRNIAVIDLQTRKAWPITAQERQDIGGFVWASNDRVLFFLDTDGNESRGIFAVNRDGTQPRMLIAPPESQIRGGSFEVMTADVVSLMEDDPRRVLVAVSRATATSVVQDLEVLDIYTGQRTRKERNPGDVVAWLADRRGTVYGALQVKDLDTIFLYRDKESQPWQEWSRIKAGEHGWAPAWRSDDGRRWYVASRLTPEGKPRDTAAIYRFDPATRAIGPLVYESAGYDVGHVLASRVADDLIGVSYVADAPEQVFLDPTWAQLRNHLVQSYPGRTVTLTSASHDERRMVFHVGASNDPGTYFLYDRDTKKFEELARAMPWLDPARLAPMQPIRLRARDGLQLHGYLTLPAGGPQRGVPMILVPHGGPRARDMAVFDPYVQLLASRGYAVLQVNFRGSIGYGHEFDKAGWREWGGKMQDDLTDAVRWSIAEGIADPARICVFGASYGGYAAMMGLALTPELFRCGVNYVGVTDIPLLLRTIPRAWEQMRAELSLQIGDPKQDAAMLKARSPVTLAPRIRAPVLMAYGKRDPRVVLEHATRFEDALDSARVPNELIVRVDEGHGYQKFGNQVDFGKRLLEFLERHLKAPATPASPATS